MGIAIISALSAVMGVIVGAVVNFVLDKSRRREERSWQTSEQQLRLYAEFLSLASRWLMEINWLSRRAAGDDLREEGHPTRRTLEELHRETLIPYGMIRMTSSPAIEDLALRILTICHEHQQDLESGLLDEAALRVNHEKWVTARTAFTEQAREENRTYLAK